MIAYRLHMVYVDNDIHYTISYQVDLIHYILMTYFIGNAVYTILSPIYTLQFGRIRFSRVIWNRQ